MSAQPRHRRRTLLASPLLAVLAVIGVLLGPAPPDAAAAGGLAHPVAGTTSPPTGSRATPSPTDDDPTAPRGDEGDEADDPDDDPVSVEVTAVTPQVVRPADELVVRARVGNAGDDVLESPVAQLRVNRFLLSTRSSLEQWATEDLDGTAGTRIASVAVPRPLDPGQVAEVELRVPASALGLSGAEEAWGARGLSVEVVDDGRRQGIARTFLLWQPTEVPVTPTRVSVLVPLTGGPVDPTVAGPEPPAPSSTGDATDEPTDTPGDPSTDDPTDADPGAAATPTGDPADAPTADAGETLAAAPLGTPSTDDLDRLDGVVDATAGVSAVAWAIDPALLAGARSPAAPAEARRWADGLTDAAVGREVVALPTLDPDLAALVHGGGDGLATEAYTRARGASDPLLGATPRADLAWPADGVPDLATADLAARVGATVLVVGPEALTTSEELSYTPSGRATVATASGDVAALVPDAELTGQLRAPSDDTAATAAQRVLAESAVVTRERPNDQRHLLLTAPRDWDPDPRVARAQLAALDSAPWVEMAGLSALVGAADPGLARSSLPDRQVADGEIRPGELTALTSSRAELAAFAQIVPDPSLLMAGADAAVLAPTSVAWRVDPVQRSLVVDGVVADLVARRSGVSVVPGSDLNLISESGRFPIGLRNDLRQDATVQVAVEPASPVLQVDGPQTVVIDALSETQVRVPFEAVGNGDVQVAVTLLSPDGVPLGAPQELTVRVHADWENVGTAVVAGLLAIALVGGIIRTIRRGQTRHRGAGTTPVADIARLPEDPS